MGIKYIFTRLSSARLNKYNKYCAALALVLLLSLIPTLYFGSRISKMRKPKLYDSYAPQGRPRLSLQAVNQSFLLNNRSLVILSGQLDYFRVHPKYWRDRLRKLRACGFNTVSSNIPWNLHNPSKGKFDFGHGDSDLSEFLDVEKFVKTAQEEDLFVILRVGPYIDADLDFGGLPSWLLTYKGIKIRTQDDRYMNAVRNYFEKLLPLLRYHQFVIGGPIIAFQLENCSDGPLPGGDIHLKMLRRIMELHGIDGPFFTLYNMSTTSLRDRSNGILTSITIKISGYQGLKVLKNILKTGHAFIGDLHTCNTHPWNVADAVHLALSLGVSLNLYMFHGGTNWGFINGGRHMDRFPFYYPQSTRYEYHALLTESGDYTVMYDEVCDVLSYLPEASWSPSGSMLPERPLETSKRAYRPCQINEYLKFNQLVDQVDVSHKMLSQDVLPMELTNISSASGQSFGFVVYHRKTALPVKRPSGTAHLQVKGHIKDVAVVVRDGWRMFQYFSSLAELKDFGYWIKEDAVVLMWTTNYNYSFTLDIIVENCGRPSPVDAKDDLTRFHKGIVSGPVQLDGVPLLDWEIVALDFNKKYINSLTGWLEYGHYFPRCPALFKTTLHVHDTPTDTIIDMSKWTKGVVFINGFNLGRYSNLCEQNKLFVPGPLLKTGENQILVFEMYKNADAVMFTDIEPISDPIEFPESQEKHSIATV